MPRSSALSSSRWLRPGLCCDCCSETTRFSRFLNINWSPWEFVVYAVLGVLGRFVSVAFTQLLLRLRAKFLRLPRNTLWFQPLFGGLLVGIMAWFVPQSLGVGYSYVGDALNGGVALKLMLLLLVLKLIGVTSSYASGNAGGIFGPSLFIGAMLGGGLGTVAHNRYPWAQRNTDIAGRAGFLWLQ